MFLLLYSLLFEETKRKKACHFYMLKAFLFLILGKVKLLLLVCTAAGQDKSVSEKGLLGRRKNKKRG